FTGTDQNDQEMQAGLHEDPCSGDRRANISSRHSHSESGSERDHNARRGEGRRGSFRTPNAQESTVVGLETPGTVGSGTHDGEVWRRLYSNDVVVFTNDIVGVGSPGGGASQGACLNDD